MNDAIEAIRRFVHVLDALGIEYLIGGSIASIVYGKARTTRDVDFVLTISPTDAGPLVAALNLEFYVDLTAVERAIADGDCFNALTTDAVFQVDVFTPKSSAWTLAQFDRRQLHRLGASEAAVDAYLASPEDIVLNKLHGYSLGNCVSKLQWEDAVGVLAVQMDRLDDAYLREWAERLELSELLLEAKRAAAVS